MSAVQTPERSAETYVGPRGLEYERAEIDEITDQSERLRAPMENSFDYDLKDGRLSFKDQFVDEILSDGLDSARQAAANNPDWQFELERRKIEYSEITQIQAFAKEVGSGVNISSISLDQSNYQATQAVTRAIGYDLPEGLGSEEILSRRFWIGEPREAMLVMSPCPDAVTRDGINIGGYNKERKKMIARVVTRDESVKGQLVNTIRSAYDGSLSKQLGGEWFGGRRPMNVQDAMAFIRSQPDLLEQHMQAVMQVKRSITDRSERDGKLEDLRYNFAAALDMRLNGQHIDAADMGEAGDAAREAGEDFSGDCPVDSNATSVANSLDKLGYRGKVKGKCPFCKHTVEYDPCAPVCPRNVCESNEGKTGHQKAKAELGRTAVRPSTLGAKPKQSITKTGGSSRPNGSSLQQKRTITVGGAKTEWIDKNTGQVIK